MPEWLDTTSKVGALITPFAIPIILLLHASRKKAWDDIVGKIVSVETSVGVAKTELSGRIELVKDKFDQRLDEMAAAHAVATAGSQRECRENINAVVAQVSAFQRDVAENYPKRPELRQQLQDFQDYVRDLLRLRDRSEQIIRDRSEQK